MVFRKLGAPAGKRKGEGRLVAGKPRFMRIMGWKGESDRAMRGAGR